MSNVATRNRDLQIARQIEDGHIIMWADGFGVWRAKVANTYAHPMGVAKLAIRLMHQERAPRDVFIDPPRVVRTPDYDTKTHHAYKEL